MSIDAFVVNKQRKKEVGAITDHVNFPTKNIQLIVVCKTELRHGCWDLLSGLCGHKRW